MLLAMLPLVASFGVTTPYWDTKPLSLHPGESQEVQLLLQNMVGEGDITLLASITEGGNIAQLLDQNLNYLIPFGTKDVPVSLRITIPEDASTDGDVKVIVSFKQLVSSNAEGEMLQMAGGVGAIIPVTITSWVVQDVGAGGNYFASVSSSTIIIITVTLVLISAAGIASCYIFRKRRSISKE
ncbi:MAG TPA: hypothetical protein VJC39_01805 [Candidatus Nanoarchaeia archaeon]|nr:hypothetical protein [Candidatus Nanoarchaeia archaeon]